MWIERTFYNRGKSGIDMNHSGCKKLKTPQRCITYSSASAQSLYHLLLFGKQEKQPDRLKAWKKVASLLSILGLILSNHQLTAAYLYSTPMTLLTHNLCFAFFRDYQKIHIQSGYQWIFKFNVLKTGVSKRFSIWDCFWRLKSNLYSLQKDESPNLSRWNHFFFF